jgi:hypothetical protein
MDATNFQSQVTSTTDIGAKKNIKIVIALLLSLFLSPSPSPVASLFDVCALYSSKQNRKNRATVRAVARLCVRACVCARSAGGISKNMQKYEKLEKIGEGEPFA